MTNQNIANVVIAILNEIEVDGEMMEHIINQVGMRDQMIKQLTHQDDIVDDKDDKVILKRGKDVAVSFSQQELIEFTREIQSRALEAAVSAIESSGVDMESHVELELNFNNQIDIEVDEDTIYSVIVDNVRDVFETDDDSIKDEIDNVIDHLFKGF
jgi:hypothetical protein